MEKEDIDKGCLDSDGYPSGQMLNYIEFIDFTKEDIKSFLDWLSDNWYFSDCHYFVLKGKRVLKLELHTGGWSGNEEIIHSLKKTNFFDLFYKKYEVGGHYYFRIDLRYF